MHTQNFNTSWSGRSITHKISTTTITMSYQTSHISVKINCHFQWQFSSNITSKVAQSTILHSVKTNITNQHISLKLTNNKLQVCNNSTNDQLTCCHTGLIQANISRVKVGIAIQGSRILFSIQKFHDQASLNLRISGSINRPRTGFKNHHKKSQFIILIVLGGSVAKWLACWTQAEKGPGSNRSHDAVG